MIDAVVTMTASSASELDEEKTVCSFTRFPRRTASPKSQGKLDISIDLSSGLVSIIEAVMIRTASSFLGNE